MIKKPPPPRVYPRVFPGVYPRVYPGYTRGKGGFISNFVPGFQPGKGGESKNSGKGVDWKNCSPCKGGKGSKDNLGSQEQGSPFKGPGPEIDRATIPI